MTTRFSTLLNTARADGEGIGAFNVILLEHAEAIVRGAEAARRPVILQISENCVRYHGALAPIVRATQAVAAAATVPAFVHLDHITSTDLIREGVDLSVDSVMFDGSHLAFDDNVQVTADMVRLCHAAGIGVEAELGEIGGKDGVHAPGARTIPHEARQFVTDTGVDALAVAVGTSHAMAERSAKVDLDVVHALAEAAPVPLVLHGSSGVADDLLSAAVTAGMTKINISTHLNGLFSGAVRGVLEADERLTDPRKYLAPARQVMADEIARLLTLLANRTPVQSVS